MTRGPTLIEIIIVIFIIAIISAIAIPNLIEINKSEKEKRIEIGERITVDDERSGMVVDWYYRGCSRIYKVRIKNTAPNAEEPYVVVPFTENDIIRSHKSNNTH